MIEAVEKSCPLVSLTILLLAKDDDCEEGEIREPGQKHVFIRPMCRFYTRGNCTWGNNCRFLHPGINDKGIHFGVH